MKLYSFVFAILISISAGAYQVPSLSGPVMDTAHMFSVQESSEMESVIREIYKKGNAQIQVLTIPTLGDETIEQVSIQITDQWKIGAGKEDSTHRDNGLLILIAQKEHKMRIEVGQGLEGDIPDAVASRIIRDVMTPYFKRGEFAKGTLTAITTIYKILAHEDLDTSNETDAYTNANEPSRAWAIAKTFFFLFFWGIFILIALVSNFRRSSGRYRGGGYWGGGGGGWGSGGGGGGWSGGGGGFSGGGSSGSW